MSTDPAQTDSPAVPTGGNGPLLVATIAGVVMGVLAGILLAFLADLPAYLGMFFFLLVGLLIGAFFYRFGRTAAPAPKGVLWASGLLVVFVTWGTSLYVGYRILIPTAVEQIEKSSRTRLGEPEKAELARNVPDAIADYLATSHPPGGFLGYMRFAASKEAKGVIKVPREPVGLGTLPIAIRYFGWQWMLRTIVSLMLLMFSIMSQVLSLSGEPEPSRSQMAYRRDMP